MTALKRISFPLIGLILIIAISCQKEEDIYPKITLLQPSSGIVYEFGDTIRTEFIVESLDGALIVGLIQGEQSIGPGFSMTENVGNRYVFQSVFTDPSLEGGNYSIRIIAYNGEGRSVELTSIVYQEPGLIRLGFAAILEESGQRQLGYLPELGVPSYTFLTGDYPHLAGSSSSGLVHIAPAISGKYKAYDLFLNQVFDVPNPAPSGSVQYHQIINDEGLVYTLENEGYIRAYGTSSAPERNFLLDNARIPLRAAFGNNGQFLVAAAEPGFIGFKALLMNPVNGFVIRATDLDEFPVGIGFSQSDFYLLCADAGTSLIYKYSPQSGILTEWARINESPVDITSTAGNCYVATNGGLYGVISNPPVGSPNRITSRLTTLPVSDLEGSFKESSVYFAAGENIYELTGTTTQVVSSVSGKQIEKLEVLYNR